MDVWFIMLEWLHLREFACGWVTSRCMRSMIAQWVSLRVQPVVRWCQRCLTPIGCKVCPKCTRGRGRLLTCDLIPLCWMVNNPRSWTGGEGARRFFAYLQIDWNCRTRSRSLRCHLDDINLHPLDFVRRKLESCPTAFVDVKCHLQPRLPALITDVV
jgi:hypothetical protein